jgi:hypothetical protein
MIIHFQNEENIALVHLLTILSWKHVVSARRFEAITGLALVLLSDPPLHLAPSDSIHSSLYPLQLTHS